MARAQAGSLLDSVVVAEPSPSGPTIVGRYVLEGEVASGGMATVYYGRRTDEAPPGTTVAVKRVHPHLARDKHFASMFIDEARLLSRIRHPNVIRTVDIIANEDECLLVMEYIHGESLGRLLHVAADRHVRPPLEVVSSIVCGALDGLDAAHEATNAMGAPLLVVHRDISPQNIIVGADGVAKLLDFGVAKAAGSLQVTRDGEMKGKLAYMSPEQVSGTPVDRRTDIYATGVVLWEAVTERPLFDGENDAAVIAAVLRQEVPVPSSVAPWVPPALDAVILRALAPDPERRFTTAAEMARALEAAVPRADIADVAIWVDALVGAGLRARQETMRHPASQTRPARTVGVTEVFFTSAAPGGTREKPAVATTTSPGGEDEITLLDEDIVTGDARDAQPTRMHSRRPPAAGSPHGTRWWLAAAGGLVLATVGLWEALKPAPPPPPGITAAPDPR